MPEAAPRTPAPLSLKGKAGRGRPWETFQVFLLLGLTSFGGPVAHLGYYRRELVQRRGWLGDSEYAQVMGLCQVLPGPTSSQVGFSLGMLRSGWPGALAAWVGFTLPSAALMIGLAYGLSGRVSQNLLHGLKLATVAIVLQAGSSMGLKFWRTPLRFVLALAVAAAVLGWPIPLVQPIGIGFAGAIGWLFLGAPSLPDSQEPMACPVTRRAAGMAWAALVCLWLALPRLGSQWPICALLARFVEAGSLVFGGGHVVLPLLRTELVPSGWIADQPFLAGYAGAQAVPGPLFSFAAYLGTMIVGGVGGGVVCLVAIFLPGFLLLVGCWPWWHELGRRPALRASLEGVNAGVVGLLLAALISPVWTSAVHGPVDLALSLLGWLALQSARVPPGLVVGLLAAISWGAPGLR